MARTENPPFARGNTFYNGLTIDSNDLGGPQLLGHEWVFDDRESTQTASSGAVRSSQFVTTRAVRNLSGFAVLPKRAVKLDALGENIVGYALTLAESRVALVDEYLLSAGCPNNDICWVVVEGPAIGLTALEGTGVNVITAGDRLVAQTAATSGATTAGRLVPQTLTGATSPLADQIQNAVAHAVTARTTANTNADVLVIVSRKSFE